MKILHFNQFGTAEGGTEAYISEVSDALLSDGHQSHLVYFSGPSTVHSPLPKTLISPTDHPTNAGLLSAVTSIIERFQPDVAFIHVVNDPNLVRVISAILPTVAYVHGPYLVCPGYAQYLRQSQIVCPRRASWKCIGVAMHENCMFGRSPLTNLRRVAQVKSYIATYQNMRILVGSQFMQDLLVRNGMTSRKITILPPVLLALDDNERYQRPAVSNRLVFAGRLVEEKGLLSLLESLAEIHSDWELIIAGDGELRPNIEPLARTLRIAHKVNFLGWQDGARMHQLYRSSSVVLLPSLWPEPYGRIGVEAFRNGRPVIAFDVGGIADWLDDGSTGFLVPAGDFDAFRARIEFLLESTDLQSKMGRKALLKAQTNWGVDEHIRTLIDTFEQAIWEKAIP